MLGELVPTTGTGILVEEGVGELRAPPGLWGA